MNSLKLYNYSFENLQEKNLSFEQVFERIVQFMKRDPRGIFRLMIGTDSQIHSHYTRFITGIVLHQERKGAWACIRRMAFPRKINNLHERISFETSLTEDIVAMFTENRKSQLIDIVLPHIYKGASFSMEGHIDIGSGKRNKTSLFVEEMVSRIEAMGIEPKIKPESFVASTYADRFTK